MKNKEQILAGMVVVLPTGGRSLGNSSVRNYRYTDADTGRMYAVTRSETDLGHRYFLEEFAPNGRVGELNEAGLCVKAWDEPIIQETEKRVGPNQLMSELAAIGFTHFDQLLFNGGGYGVGTKFYTSMEDCAAEIEASLLVNERYVYFRPLEQDEADASEAKLLKGKAQYWQNELAEAQSAALHGEGIFKGCWTMTGNIISDEAKRSILEYLNSPSQDAWLDIRNLTIAGPVSCWQAWVLVDRDAPRSGRIGYPSSETLRCAIRAAVEDRVERIHRELAECLVDAQPESGGDTIRKHPIGLPSPDDIPDDHPTLSP